MIGMMECSIFGRKQNILQLLRKLKNLGCCSSEEIQYPEAFPFCGGSDRTNVKIVSSCKFLDFSVLKERAFRCLAIQLKLNGYLFEKRKGYQKVFMRESPIQLEKPHQVMMQKQIPFLKGGDEPILGTYETLELFEERMERRNDNKRFD